MIRLPLKGNEGGYTMVEVSAVLLILGSILAITLGALSRAEFDVETQMSRSETNDQAMLAAQSMDREMRSGDLIYDPSQESYTGDGADIVAGYSMRLLSEANVPTRGDKRCVQYRITQGGELQRRDWDPEWQNSNDPNRVTGWRILASGLQNRAQNQPAFTLPKVNLASILLLVNARPGTGPISGRVHTVSVQLSVSGRNSAIVTNLQQCGPDQPAPLVPTSSGREVPPYS